MRAPRGAVAERGTRGGRVGRKRGVARVAVLLVALVAAGCARPPYTTDARTTSITVNFATYASSPAPVVRFSEAGGSCRGREVTAGAPTTIQVSGRTLYQYEAHLTGLTPESRYCYRVVQGSTDILGNFPSGTFRTAPSPGDATPFSFAVLGDWGFGTPAQSRVLAQIANSDAQFVVTVGDNEQTGGGQSDYGDVSSGNVFPLQFWPVVGINKPVFPAIGNHDLDSRSSGGLPYLQNFPQDATVAASGGRLRQETYCCTASDPAPNASPAPGTRSTGARHASTSCRRRGPRRRAPPSTAPTSRPTGTVRFPDASPAARS